MSDAHTAAERTPRRLGGWLGRWERLPSLVGGVLLWELVARLVQQRYLPPPSAVLVRLVELVQDGEILPNLANSLTNLLIGFVISATVGVTVGVLMGRYEPVATALKPYVNALLASPTIVFAPVYFTLFGLSRMAIIALIVQYATFIIIVNTQVAVEQVDGRLVEMARVYGATERQRIWKVIVPAALPLTMSGLRVGMGRCVRGMINGELLIAVVGLGAMSQEFGRAFDAEGVFAILVVIVTVALLATALVQVADRRVNGWLPKAQR